MSADLYVVTGSACGESWPAGWWGERQPAECFATTARRAAEALREAKRRAEASREAQRLHDERAKEGWFRILKPLYFQRQLDVGQRHVSGRDIGLAFVRDRLEDGSIEKDDPPPGFVRPAALRGEEKARAELRRLDPAAERFVDEGSTVRYDVEEVHQGLTVAPVPPEPEPEPEDPAREAFLQVAREECDDGYHGPDPTGVARLAALWDAREVAFTAAAVKGGNVEVTVSAAPVIDINAWRPIRVSERLPEIGVLVLAWTPEGADFATGREGPGWEPARYQRHGATSKYDEWEAQDACRSAIRPEWWLPLPPAPLQADAWSKPGPSPVPDVAAARDAIRASGDPDLSGIAAARRAIRADAAGAHPLEDPARSGQLVALLQEVLAEEAKDPAALPDVVDLLEALRRIMTRRYDRILAMLRA